MKTNLDNIKKEIQEICDELENSIKFMESEGREKSVILPCMEAIYQVLRESLVNSGPFFMYCVAHPLALSIDAFLDESIRRAKLFKETLNEKDGNE